jgi:DNA adenine methylase
MTAIIARPKSGKQSSKPSTLSPLRYPGGKSWFREQIIKWIQSSENPTTHFVEPYAGGASVGLAIAELNLANEVILSELDPEICALWKIILSDENSKLQSLILDLKVSREELKVLFNKPISTELDRAFHCLVRNRVQRGGIISEGAGLIKRGENDNGVKSRWYPKTLKDRLQSISELKTPIVFKNQDALLTIKEFKDHPGAFFFVDPPYTIDGEGPGKRLYNFHEIDHKALFSALTDVKGKAVITFHNSSIIRQDALKVGLHITTRGMRNSHHTKQRELVLKTWI